MLLETLWRIQCKYPEILTQTQKKDLGISFTQNVNSRYSRIRFHGQAELIYNRQN